MARKSPECGFAIDRSSTRSHVDQVYKGMRERIFAGKVRVGQAVPSLRSLADSLGVSVKVTTTAYARLARDGWLRAEPRAFSRADQGIGVFCHAAPPTRLCLEFPRETGLILMCARKVGNAFQTKQGN